MKELIFDLLIYLSVRNYYLAQAHKQIWNRQGQIDVGETFITLFTSEYTEKNIKF